MLIADVIRLSLQSHSQTHSVGSVPLILHTFVGLCLKQTLTYPLNVNHLSVSFKTLQTDY